MSPGHLRSWLGCFSIVSKVVLVISEEGKGLFLPSISNRNWLRAALKWKNANIPLQLTAAKSTWVQPQMTGN